MERTNMRSYEGTRERGKIDQSDSGERVILIEESALSIMKEK